GRLSTESRSGSRSCRASRTTAPRSWSPPANSPLRASPPRTHGRARPTARTSTCSRRPNASRRSGPWRTARPNSPTSARAVFSVSCCSSLWLASSPTRSMAATPTRSPGRCSAFPVSLPPMPTRSTRTATNATSRTRSRSRTFREREAHMATKLKEVDAVMVGMGWTGAIMARELTKAGLNVVGLERGADRNPAEEFTLTRLRDELRYVVRLELMQDNSIDTITFRNAPDELALPIRRFGAFLPGEGVGGTGIHWGALHWRFLPTDFRIKSLLTEKYGAKTLPPPLTL